MGAASEIHERSLSESSDVSLNDFRFVPKPVFGFFKRVFDITFSFVCIIVLALPFLIVFAAILIDDKDAPAIFTQKRIGRNGKEFKIYKFRTMCANAEEKLSELQNLNEMDGPAFKIQNDPRITRVGRFLRRYNIDELPQLFNIIMGQMSFVGPRPPLPKEVAQYRESDRLRLLVTPGLTCYWQITSDRNAVSFDEWMKMDRQYIMERCPVVDIRLILKTVVFCIRQKG